MTPSALHSGSRETEPLFIARSHHRNTLWLQEHYYASTLLSLSLSPPTVIIALEALIVCRFLLALPRSNSVTCLPYGRSLSLRHVIVVSCPFYYFRCVVLLSLYSPV